MLVITDKKAFILMQVIEYRIDLLSVLEMHDELDEYLCLMDVMDRLVRWYFSEKEHD